MEDQHVSSQQTSNMQVRDAMTTDVVTIQEHQTRQQAAKLLSQHRVSGLPVVNNDNMLVGVVTEYDILSRDGNTVGDIMTRSVISVSADTDLDTAGHILVHERIRRLPVLDRGKVIGILSRADLVREVATGWLCTICGETLHSDEQPTACPRCGSTKISNWSGPISPGS